MKSNIEKRENTPLLYHRTMEQIREYREKPVEYKLSWLQSQMEFFYYAMSEKAKEIREKFKQSKLSSFHNDGLNQ